VELLSDGVVPFAGAPLVLGVLVLVAGLPPAPAAPAAPVALAEWVLVPPAPALVEVDGDVDAGVVVGFDGLDEHATKTNDAAHGMFLVMKPPGLKLRMWVTQVQERYQTKCLAGPVASLRGSAALRDPPNLTISARSTIRGRLIGHTLRSDTPGSTRFT
jgi:hypothetical protein